MKPLLVAILVVSLLSMASVAQAGQLVASPGQLFWVNGTWIPADQLHPGDKFMTADGHAAVIKTIQDVPLHQNASCFSLATSPPQDFFANNMLARDISPKTGQLLYTTKPPRIRSPIELVVSKLRDFFSQLWRMKASNI
jgi:hypothetical protein